MNFAVSFHRAARTEFIEASVWHEDSRDLALSSWRKLSIAYRLLLKAFLCLRLSTRIFGALSPTDFRIAFIFARKHAALLCWRYFTAEEDLNLDLEN